MKIAVAVLTVLLLATGCGGSSSGSHGYDSAAAVAKAAGCTGFEAESASDMEMFVADSGTCKQGSSDATVNWFKDGNSLKNYRKVADQVGGSLIVYGKNFAIECGAKADCEAAAKSTGGKLG